MNIRRVRVNELIVDTKSGKTVDSGDCVDGQSSGSLSEIVFDSALSDGNPTLAVGFKSS